MTQQWKEENEGGSAEGRTSVDKGEDEFLRPAGRGSTAAPSEGPVAA